jgi:hypothetical protein
MDEFTAAREPALAATAKVTAWAANGSNTAMAYQ